MACSIMNYPLNWSTAVGQLKVQQVVAQNTTSEQTPILDLLVVRPALGQHWVIKDNYLFKKLETGDLVIQ